jgi:hypothetical protein
MSRFLIAMFVGATIAAAVSTSASAWHCLASSPNGAAGTAFGVTVEKSAVNLNAPVHTAAVGLVAKSHGAGRTKRRTLTNTRYAPRAPLAASVRLVSAMKAEVDVAQRSRQQICE